MASCSSLVGGSRRSGRELISTATSKLRQASKTTSGSNVDWGRSPRSPSISRPVQWPSTLVRGLAMAATIRWVMVSESERSLECTLATTTSSSPSRPSSWSRPPSSRMSTSMPRSTRNGASTLVQIGDHLLLLPQPLGSQAAGDLEPRRVVGDRAVGVPERLRGDHHLLQRTAAVGPDGVAVQVALDHPSASPAALDQRLLLVPELLQVVRHVAGHRLTDHQRGLRVRCRSPWPSCAVAGDHRARLAVIAATTSAALR